MRNKVMLFIFSSAIIFLNCVQALNENEKMKVFYKNEWLFFFGRANGVIEKTAIEEDNYKKPYLPVFSIEEISKEYRNIIPEYMKIFDTFIAANFLKLKEYYELIDSNTKDKARFNNVDQFLTEKLKTELLPKLKNGIRCMLAVKETQYIEVAKEIDKNVYAATVTNADPVDDVYWFRYLKHPELVGMKREDILDSQGNIKYHEFFYESNLKIRIIKQIRDEKGNYYGELYADYYKLDQYDKLFDAKGNPRNPKK